jgi:nicotinamide riboside transporter PnuC
VEARHPSALARVCCIYVAGLSYLWFSLVDRACSWLFCLSNDIIYKKVSWVLFPCVEVFHKMYMLCSGVAQVGAYGWVAMVQHCLWRNKHAKEV